MTEAHGELPKAAKTRGRRATPVGILAPALCSFDFAPIELSSEGGMGYRPRGDHVNVGNRHYLCPPMQETPRNEPSLSI